MSALSCAGQAQACLLRVARLDADGAPLEGVGNLYVTEKMISLGWSPNIDGGDELDQSNGCGDEIIFFQAPDRLRNLELDLTIVAPEPELLEMLAGGTVHELTGDTRGYGMKGPGTLGGLNDVSIELWERIIVDGSIAGYARYVFPRTRNWALQGNTHENDVLDVELEGIAVQAGTWGDGPGFDWDDLSESGPTIYDWAIEENELPVAECGAQELTAPA